MRREMGTDFFAVSRHRPNVGLRIESCVAEILITLEVFDVGRLRGPRRVHVFRGQCLPCIDLNLGIAELHGTASRPVGSHRAEDQQGDRLAKIIGHGARFGDEGVFDGFGLTKRVAGGGQGLLLRNMAAGQAGRANAQAEMVTQHNARGLRIRRQARQVDTQERVFGRQRRQIHRVPLVRPPAKIARVKVPRVDLVASNLGPAIDPLPRDAGG